MDANNNTVFSFTVNNGDDVERAIKETVEEMYKHSIRKYNYYKAGTGVDAYKVSLKILKELYPDGVKPDQLDTMLVVWEITRKLVVIAMNRKPADGDESVFSDVAGWAVRAVADEKQKTRQDKEMYDDR